MVTPIARERELVHVEPVVDGREPGQVGGREALCVGDRHQTHVPTDRREVPSRLPVGGPVNGEQNRAVQ